MVVWTLVMEWVSVWWMPSNTLKFSWKLHLMRKKAYFNSVICKLDNLPCFSHAHMYMSIYFSTIMWNPKTNQFPDTLYARRLIYLSLNLWYLKLYICNVIKLVSLTSMLQLCVCKLGLAQINTLYNFQYLFKFELYHIVSRLRNDIIFSPFSVI